MLKTNGDVFVVWAAFGGSIKNTVGTIFGFFLIVIWQGNNNLLQIYVRHQYNGAVGQGQGR